MLRVKESTFCNSVKNITEEIKQYPSSLGGECGKLERALLLVEIESWGVILATFGWNWKLESYFGKCSVGANSRAVLMNENILKNAMQT